MSADIVLGKTKKIEGALRRRGCLGYGLRELANNAGSLLGSDVKAACHYVAGVRNSYAHVENYSMSDKQLAHFVDTTDFILSKIDVASWKGNYIDKMPERLPAAANLSVSNQALASGLSSAALHYTPVQVESSVEPKQQVSGDNGSYDAYAIRKLIILLANVADKWLWKLR